MLWLKSCPRCHGDLHESSDEYGGYIACFQCGHYLALEEEVDLKSETPIFESRAVLDVPVLELAEIGV